MHSHRLAPATAPWRWGPPLLVLLLGLVAASCRTYRPRPLSEASILASVRAARLATPVADDLGLVEATRHLRRGNPAIREARAAYETARRVAAVRTPRANPTLGVGPLLFGGADVLRNGTWGVEAALGWALPLTSRRALQDHVNAVRARAALARAVAVARRQYLGLRADFVRAALLAQQLQAQRDLGAAATASVDAGRQMVGAGQASAVELALLRLDAARTGADVLEGEETFHDAHQALAARMGLAAQRLGVPGDHRLPVLPQTLPTAHELEAGAIRSHPELCVLRAEYLVAEKELRLEAAKQFPDLELGLSYEREDGHRLGLPLGIELPLFDRNQVAIAAACAARDETRARYRAELERVLARVAQARGQVEARRRRLVLLETEVGPEAARTLETTRRALAAGETDALRYLEVLRTTRAASLQVLQVRAALYEAWAGLEDACGFPVLRFPDDGPDPLPVPPPAPPIPLADPVKEPE